MHSHRRSFGQCKTKARLADALPQQPPDFAPMPDGGGPTGLEHIGAEDTPDYDYGPVLERALGAATGAGRNRPG